MNKAIFLDRDGVLNKTIFRMGKERAPYTLEEFVLFDGVEHALKLLKNKEYLLIVVTNQPDVARGWVEMERVTEVNEKLKELLPLDEIKACFHTDKDNCHCRKPRPGMLIEAQKKWNINPHQSYMVGDNFTDIAAGVAIGCKTVLIGSAINDEDKYPSPHFRAKSLREWVEQHLTEL
jgi:D-glycero-D-manno-heptose 1,7-bisphosphate phosphatase